jgi:CBS domain-containing protein
MRRERLRGSMDGGRRLKEAVMKVGQLMTRSVLTIGPEAPIKDVAKLMVQHRISGLPVCDVEGHVVGVISEGDILYKEYDPYEGYRGGPLAWLSNGSSTYRGFTKSRALAARAAMTSPAITIAPYQSVSEAARMMSELGVNRLPVVKDGKLVGIITRGDLLRAFTRTDHEIEQEIREDVLERTLWIDTDRVEVEVANGVVRLDGLLHTRSDADVLCRLVARVPGVSSVESTVRWHVDDTTRQGRRELERPLA